MNEILFILIIFILFLIIMSVFFSNIITVRRKTVKLSRNVTDKRIVYLADVFSNRHRVRTKRVIEKTKKLSPDLVVISGYGYGECPDDIKALIDGLCNLVPVYFVFSDRDNGDKSVADGEIKILKDYSLISVCDKCSNCDELLKFSRLENIRIAVFAKPADFDVKTDFEKADVTFSWYGGGLMLRIPFFGIVFSSKEGIAPKYPSRFYMGNHSVFAVTTGAGNSYLPFRLNNFREIICIDLKK